eukprot:7617499-Heterocapsa_arctica.AAC.1
MPSLPACAWAFEAPPHLRCACPRLPGHRPPTLAAILWSGGPSPSSSGQPYGRPTATRCVRTCVR